MATFALKTVVAVLALVALANASPFALDSFGDVFAEPGDPCGPANTTKAVFSSLPPRIIERLINITRSPQPNIDEIVELIRNITHMSWTEFNQTMDRLSTNIPSTKGLCDQLKSQPKNATTAVILFVKVGMMLRCGVPTPPPSQAAMTEDFRAEPCGGRPTFDALMAAHPRYLFKELMDTHEDPRPARIIALFQLYGRTPQFHFEESLYRLSTVAPSVKQVCELLKVRKDLRTWVILTLQVAKLASCVPTTAPPAANQPFEEVLVNYMAPFLY